MQNYEIKINHIFQALNYEMWNAKSMKNMEKGVGWVVTNCLKHFYNFPGDKRILKHKKHKCEGHYVTEYNCLDN